MKKQTLDRLIGAAVTAYILVYVYLTYVFLIHRAFSRPGDIALGEVAVVANVALGILLTVIWSTPRFQIIGSVIMLFTYSFYQILALRLTSFDQVGLLITAPATLLILPLLLPLVVGITRHLSLAK